MNTSSLHAALLLAALSSIVSLPAQEAGPVPGPSLQGEPKPPRTADPAKGYGEVTAFTGAERRTARRSHADAAAVRQLLAGPTAAAADRVRYSVEPDGRTWASGATYKASFGRDGFAYLPFLGRSAPKNYPVRFALEAVRIGDVALPCAKDAAPVRRGDRVEFVRGAVREVYDLSPRAVEQTFVVEDDRAGDLVVELRVTTELREDATRPGLQFVHQLGGVDYGTAYVVDGDRKTEVAAEFAGDTLTLVVPQHLRPRGAVVVDPVISTSYVSFATQDFDEPDVAYDASSDHYLVVWQREFSATDCDVWCEMRDGSGAYVPGSALAIENGDAHLSKPRVANLAAYHDFLVVAELFQSAYPPGQQYSVWGRTVDAASPFTLGTFRAYSGTEAGDKRDPDVGGDGNGVYVPPTLPCWTIAYTRELSSTDHDILVRQVHGGGTPVAGSIFVENSANTIYRDVEISQASGIRPADERRWVLVYSYKFSSSDWDVYGAVLDRAGLLVQPSAALDRSSASHRNPAVSSPTHRVAGPAAFGVTFEDGGNVADLRGMVVNSMLQTVVPVTNLSNLLGAGTTFYARIETDGCRFVVAYASSQPAYVATLGVVNGAFVVHEPPQVVRPGTDAYAANLTSRGITGGTDTGYALVFADHAPAPDRIVFATYDGHAAGGTSIRPTGCGGLGIAATGEPLLGRTLQVNLTGGNGFPTGMLLGVPGPAVALCTGCSMGVSLSGALVNLPNRTQLDLPIPCVHVFVGRTVAVQGYGVGGGSCFGTVRLGDTLDVTIE